MAKVKTEEKVKKTKKVSKPVKKECTKPRIIVNNDIVKSLHQFGFEIQITMFIKRKILKVGLYMNTRLRIQL